MKKILSFLLVLCLFAAMTGVQAAAKTVLNVTDQRARVVQTSTVYAGEILVDGTSVFRYLYSDDILDSSSVLAALRDAFKMADHGGFVALFQGRNPSESSQGIGYCSDTACEGFMSAAWTDASYVAGLYYPGLILGGILDEDLYDCDAGFAGYCRSNLADEGIDLLDDAGYPYSPRGVCGVLSSTATDSTTYYFEEGELVKHIDRVYDYTLEEIAVLYTCAEMYTSMPFEYRDLPDGTLEIYNYVGTDDEVTVPPRIECKTVTGIAADLAANAYDVFAWQDGEYNFHSPSRIRLPDTLTYIGEFAFASCLDLTEIAIPAGVTSIGDYAFTGCEGLTEVTVPEGVTLFGCEVFDCCTALQRVVLPDSLTDIPRGTFFFCSSLTDVTLPAALTAIGDDMFNGCASLTAIVIPETVASIGQQAFFDTGLRSITIPAGTAVVASETETDIHGDPYAIYYYPVGYVTDPDTGDPVPADGFTVRCYHGTSGEAYALECGFNLEYLDTLDGERLYGRSISLEGDISVNFYMDLDDSVASSATAVMRFTLPGGRTEEVPVSSALKKTVGGSEYYVFKAHVAAKDMTAPVTGRIVDGDQQGAPYTFSVKEYADYLLAHSDIPEYAKAVSLVKAMLNYGAAAQTYFNAAPGTLANAGLSDADKVPGEVSADGYAHSLTGTDANIIYVGSSLLLESETALRHYFTVSGNVNDYSFTVDGAAVTPGRYEDMYYVEIAGVAVKDLDETFEVKAGGLTVNDSPLSYAWKVLNVDNAVNIQKLKDLAKWLIRYNAAANAYFG